MSFVSNFSSAIEKSDTNCILTKRERQFFLPISGQFKNKKKKKNCQYISGIKLSLCNLMFRFCGKYAYVKKNNNYNFKFNEM